MKSKAQIKVLMVCLGNICRSPTAEAVLRMHLQAAGIQELVHVASAGTSDWHVGEMPDDRTIEAAASRNYDLSDQVGRQIKVRDFTTFDYILAMDKQNLQDLQKLCPEKHQHKISLFLSHADTSHEEMPDPYNHGNDAFELVLDLAEDASEELVIKLKQQLSANAAH